MGLWLIRSSTFRTCKLCTLYYTATNPSPSLRSINQYCVMKKRDLFAMKERDLKFNKTVKFSLSVANLRNQAMLYGSLHIYLRHTLIILSGNID